MALTTKIMGILNVTPDSCYDGGRYLELEKAIAHGLKLYRDGADVVDIGGESTRPGAEPVGEAEELRRVIPVIEGLRAHLPIPISIDTKKPAVAAQALAAGATLLNDITGFRDPAMVSLAANSNCDICVMHMQGEPKTMQLNPHYPEGVITHLLRWFTERTDSLIQAGIAKERIILDPGIGFGKTVDHNIEILQNLRRLRDLGFRLLLGVSRKSFMQKITGKERETLLPPTIAVNTLMMVEGVDIIRVHDVAEHCLCREVLKQLTRPQPCHHS